jgi:hypothetical protein
MRRRDFIVSGTALAVALKADGITRMLKDKKMQYGNLYTKPMYYYKDGSPIWYGPGEENAHKATMEWARLFEDFPYRRIGDTMLPNGVRVSTVWLGLDHSFGGVMPQIFESMAFAAEVKVHKAGEGGLLTRDFEYHEELDCERYATEDEARKGHMRMCEKFFAGSLTLGVPSGT